MNSIQLAQSIRRSALRMVHRAKASHIGACLSIADILAVLYGEVMRVDPRRPTMPDRDRFVLSKGHAAAALHAALTIRGFIPAEWLESYGDDGTHLAGHVTHHGVPGVELSTGSLGHGLSVATGMALAARQSTDNQPQYRCFVVLGDGECQEGSVWEAAMFAARHHLQNLQVIVDHNRWQGLGTVDEVMQVNNLAERWRTFGWRTLEIDGHDHEALREACSVPALATQPTAIIARTVKGKGVSFMEDELAWHYKSPNDEQLEQALAETANDGELTAS